MNYYQHHIGDFIRDTARLSDSQCMAYLRLIWMYYETESPLDCDIDALAFKLGANASDVHQILKHFFFLHDGMWHNSRCDKEILSFVSRSEKAKKSANARWSNANAMRTHSERNSDHSEDQAQCERMQTHQNTPIVDEKIGGEDAQTMRTHSERNANERVCDANQEPVTNKSTTDVVDKPAPKKPARFDPLSIDLPSCLSADSWRSWVAYRRSRKITCAEATIRGQLKNLSAWSSAGHSPDSIIKASIDNGWQGLFEPKVANVPTARPATGRQTAISNYAAQAAAARGDHGIARQDFTERDITGESARVA